MRIEDLKVGMKIQIGDSYAKPEGYENIVGKQAIITHLNSHPDQNEKKNFRRFLWVYVANITEGASYVDYKHPTLMHLARNEALYSWHIVIEDVIVDNEMLMEALPLW